ncbi:MAG TPA: lysophospholipid acyltransferase family protein [Gemmatimonadaceae bacterium]|nr:lysophospholipid acyltransferase family protein [Gemmatimonadaceae bacterium]
MRRVIRGLLKIILRVFFPRIELAGIERIPAEGPVILAVNHPNGLIDPLFLLCLSPRPVSFLAKAPLFDMPVIGWFVKALGSIPVYRRQDGGFDASKNRKTFERARAILSGGGVIAIFPEGASHGDPKLRPLKTGAARIALGAASMIGQEKILRIAPVGIYYTAKGIFRSSALLYFGEPITVSSEPLGAEGEPVQESVRALTSRIQKSLADVTIQADEREALALVAQAEEVLSSEDPSADARLVDRFELRRRIMAGYTTLRERAPERLATVSARVAQYIVELRQSGLDPKTLKPPGDVLTRPGNPRVVKELDLLVLVLPLAIVGTVVNYPVYRLVGFVTARLSRDDDDIVATIKIIAGALLFPLSWILLAILAGIYWGAWTALVTLILAPLTGYAALVFFERLSDSIGGARALLMSRFRRWGYLKLVAERSAIRDELAALAEEYEGK